MSFDLVTNIGLIGFVAGIFAVRFYFKEYLPLKNFVQQKDLWGSYIAFRAKLEAQSKKKR